VNYAYSPVVFPSPELRERAFAALTAAGFAARRYFAPALNRVDSMGDATPMPVAEELSERILCLHLGPETSLAEIEKMAQVVSSVCPAPRATEPLLIPA
jgi:dTDP-4-amino-4,6-dideoxygalactose transaminase